MFGGYSIPSTTDLSLHGEKPPCALQGVTCYTIIPSSPSFFGSFIVNYASEEGQKSSISPKRRPLPGSARAFPLTHHVHAIRSAQ